MSRAKWKGPYLKLNNKKTINNFQANTNLIATRNTEISPKFVGKTFAVHNGKKFNEISVYEEMIGHKFGEFSATRKPFLFKKKKTKK